MRRSILAVIGVLGIIFSLSLNAQRTTYFKFRVNGAEDTVMTQSVDAMVWECNCGVGDTLIGELWYDLDGDHTIDAGDKSWPMTQIPIIDGAADWDNGPADSSATPDGIFYCTLPPIIVMAPSYYVMKVTNLKDSSTAQDWLRVKPNPSPAAAVSGTVSIEGITPPNSLLNAITVATNMDHDPVFCMSLTDSYGVYTLNLPDTGIRHISAVDNIPLYTKPPEDTVRAVGTVTGINFEYKQAEAFVYGDIKDERDSLVLKGFNVYLRVGNGDVSQAFTNNGHYLLGASAGTGYYLETNRSEVNPDYLNPDMWSQTFSLVAEDSIRKDITLIRTDTVIFGIVTENGGTPSKSYFVEASKDSLTMRWNIRSSSNSTTGAFAIPVNKGFQNYQVNLNTKDTPLPSGFGFESGNGWFADPGDTVKVKLVSYKGSASGTLTVDAGDPAPNFNNFMVTLQDTAGFPPQQRGEAQVDTNGTYKVYGPQGTLNLSVMGGSENWLIKPWSKQVTIDTVNVPGNNFLLNYGHCTVSGYLHGLDSVPSQNCYMNANGDGGSPNGYQVTRNISDTSYSLKLCDANWTLQAPWKPEWDVVYYQPNDSSFVITESDNSINIDFTYVKVGVEDKPITLVTALNSALPNPFNGKMAFRYSCAVPTKVALTVYDMSGRTVKTLVNETKKAGYYTANWDGKDNENRLLPSGVYFCKFSAQDEKTTQKLILIR